MVFYFVFYKITWYTVIKYKDKVNYLKVIRNNINK